MKRILIFISGMVFSAIIILSGLIGYSFIFNKTFLKKNTVNPAQNVIQSNEIQKQKVVIVLQKIQKGEKITPEKLQVTDIYKPYLPQNVYSSIESVVGKKAVIDLEPNIVLTPTMVIEPKDFYRPDERLIDYELVSSLGIKEGQYIDVELVRKDGSTAVVLSKKKVIKVLDGGKTIIQTTFRERQLMNRAINEIQTQGGRLETVLYLDESQPGSVTNYLPSNNSSNFIPQSYEQSSSTLILNVNKISEGEK